MNRQQRKRTKANLTENALGLQQRVTFDTAHAMDYFTNPAARMGAGTPSLAESADYEMVRLSYDYWKLIVMYRNHWISRRIIDMPAADMVRAWPRLTSDIDPKDMSRIDKTLRKTNSKAKILAAMQWARLFGGAGCLIALKNQENELDQPLDLDSIGIHDFKGLVPFDRWSGIQPDGSVCTDIDRPLDFGLPEHYSVNVLGGESFKVHATRILRFTGPEVPTPEREAQTWWGISSLEPVYEEIKKRDNMSWNILSLSFRANILGMKFPDLAQLLSGLGSNQKASAAFEQRMSTLNHLMGNNSLVPLPADGGIESTSYTFSGLAECYQQFQLDISGAAQIPVSRLWGKTLGGLGNGTNEGDERVYEERISADQDKDLRPQLEKLYPVLCMSEMGEVPDDLDLAFPSIRVMDPKDKSELAKTTMDTVVVAMNGGIISPRTAGKELKQSSVKTDLFTNITDEAIEKLSDEVSSEGELGEGLFGGLNPSASPAKEIKEENKVGKAAKEPTDKPEETQASPKQAQANDADGPAVQKYQVQGLDVVIETHKGEIRSGKDWSNTMPADYGYFPGVLGADGDSLDCYVVDPESDSQYVYVVDQSVLGSRRKFDEHKVILGVKTRNEALNLYTAGHHKAKDVFSAITPMTVEEFKRWTATADLSRPCSETV